ncbi:MAG: trypsin-like peptidase domain-containing protein [Chloroflexota bacterium]
MAMIQAVAVINGTRYTVPPDGLRIGRAPENDVVLSDPNVSRQHLVIWSSDRGIFLRDLGSQNGSYIGGRRVGAGPEAIPTGANVRIGVTDFQVEVTSPGLPPTQHQVPPAGGAYGGTPYGGGGQAAPPYGGAQGGQYGGGQAGPYGGGAPYGGRPGPGVAPAPSPYGGPSGPGGPQGGYAPRPTAAPSGSNTGLIIGGVVGVLILAVVAVGALALNMVAETRESRATATPTSRPVSAAATSTPAPKPTTAPTAVAVAKPTAAPKPTEPPAKPTEPPAKPTAPPAKPAGGRDPNFVRALNASVRVIVPTGPSSASTGSGSIITPQGHILTNYHVVSDDAGKLINGGNNVIIAVPPNEGDPAQPKYRAKVAEFDSKLDLAIIQLLAMADGSPLPGNLGLTPIPIGSSKSVEIGDTIVIIGFPGLGGSSLTVTRGIHSGISRFTDDPGSFIKTDTEINRGNSGGTAINSAGELIGIPTAGRFDKEAPGKIGLVRPIDEAKPLIEKVAR